MQTKLSQDKSLLEIQKFLNKKFGENSLTLHSATFRSEWIYFEITSHKNFNWNYKYALVTSNNSQNIQDN